MVIDVKLDGHPAKALVDQQTTGASLINSAYPSTYNLLIVELPEDVRVNLPLQGSREKSTYYVIANLDIGGPTPPVTFCIAASAKKNPVVTRYISRCALYTPHISSFVSWRPAFSFPPCPPSHFAFRPIHIHISPLALSTSTSPRSPYSQPHVHNSLLSLYN